MQKTVAKPYPGTGEYELLGGGGGTINLVQYRACHQTNFSEAGFVRKDPFFFFFTF